MGAIFGLLGGIKGMVMIALVIAALGWVAVQRSNVQKANLARDQAIVQRDMAGQQRDRAIAVARENAETITRLEEEKNLVNAALNTLQANQEQNRASSVTRELIIQQQESLPTNIGAAAPVLGDIISQIQSDRVRRRGNGVVEPPVPSVASTVPVTPAAPTVPPTTGQVIRQ